jgi:hypothetical protein
MFHILDSDLWFSCLIQVLNVHKPPGLTRYGRRKQREESAARASEAAQAIA